MISQNIREEIANIYLVYKRNNGISLECCTNNEGLAFFEQTVIHRGKRQDVFRPKTINCYVSAVSRFQVIEIQYYFYIQFYSEQNFLNSYLLTLLCL